MAKRGRPGFSHAEKSDLWARWKAGECVSDIARAAVADEAEKLLAGGFRAAKLRLGYPTLEADLAAVHAVRSRIPTGVALMVDYNQALAVPEAIRRGRALDGEGDGASLLICILYARARPQSYAKTLLFSKLLHMIGAWLPLTSIWTNSLLVAAPTFPAKRRWTRSA